MESNDPQSCPEPPWPQAPRWFALLLEAANCYEASHASLPHDWWHRLVEGKAQWNDTPDNALHPDQHSLKLIEEAYQAFCDDLEFVKDNRYRLDFNTDELRRLVAIENASFRSSPEWSFGAVHKWPRKDNDERPRANPVDWLRHLESDTRSILDRLRRREFVKELLPLEGDLLRRAEARAVLSGIELAHVVHMAQRPSRDGRREEFRTLNALSQRARDLVHRMNFWERVAAKEAYYNKKYGEV